MIFSSGLTLSKGIDGKAEVSKIKPDGQASKCSIMIGDTLIGIESTPITGYDQAMLLLSESKYPLRLYFRRGSIHNLIFNAGLTVNKGSQVCEY